MKMIIPLFYLVVVYCLSACNTEEKQRIKEKAILFSSALDSMRSIMKIPRLSAAIVYDGNIVWEDGFGNADSSTPVTGDTRYAVGSLKNIFTAVLVLQLAEERKISLNDRISKYKMVGADSSDVRIKDILTYTGDGVPGTGFRYNETGFRKLEAIVKQVEGIPEEQQLKKKIFREVGMKYTDQDAGIIWSSATDMARFSSAVMNNDFFKEKAYTDNYIFKSVYFTTGEDAPSSMGWFVQELKKEEKVIWAFGSASLIMMIPSRKLSLVVMANSPVNDPFKLEHANIFNSPVATTFLRRFFFTEKDLPVIDYSAADTAIIRQLRETLTGNYRELYLREVIANMEMYRYSNNQQLRQKFSNLYQAVYPLELPLEYIDETPLAGIEHVMNRYNVEKDFLIKKDDSVRVFCVGECVYGELEKPGENDEVNVFFRPQSSGRDKHPDKMYRFTYASAQISGDRVSTEGVTQYQFNPASNKYVINIKLPWKSLGYSKPQAGAIIDFDLSVTDNDGTLQGRKYWHTAPDKDGKKTTCGTLVLGNSQPITSGAAYSHEMPAEKILSDGIWKKCKAYPLSISTGNINGKNDLDATFKTVWNEEGLFLQVTVTDDFKQSPSLLYLEGDYGWITRHGEADTIWQMKALYTRHAGGFVRNRMVDTVLALPAGCYVLHYVSDNSHAFRDWNDAPPEVSLYGIKLFSRKNQ